MHLHPKWQQSVVNELKTAFPNVQFIATTHSPFIVQSLKAEELINLDAVVEEDPDRMSIQEVTSHIMKVEPRSLEYQQDFDITTEYLNLLSLLQKDKEGNKNEIKLKLNDIEKAAEINDPAVAAFLKMNRLAVVGKYDSESKNQENQ